MNKKTYLKGNRSVEVSELSNGIRITFFIMGVQINFHEAPCLDLQERQTIFSFLNK